MSSSFLNDAEGDHRTAQLLQSYLAVTTDWMDFSFIPRSPISELSIAYTTARKIMIYNIILVREECQTRRAVLRNG